MKNLPLKVVNGLLFLCFVVQFTGIILFNLIELDRPSFYNDLDLHKNVGLAIGVLIIAHLYLNWGWVRNTVFGPKKKKV